MRANAPIVFLVVSLGLIAVLGWQALAAAAGHRALARRVLRDYADLAATELIRRGSTFVFTYGFDVAALALARTPTDPGTWPSRDALTAAIPQPSKRALELVDDFVRVDTTSARFESSGEAVSREVQSEVIAALRAPSTSSAPSRIIVSTADGRTRVFAFSNEGARTSAESTHEGFSVRLDGMRTWLEEFVLREPLLPPALAWHAVAQSSLSINVWLPDGRALLQSADREIPGDLVATRPWSDDASRRALPGFRVVSGIDPSAASSLIIGGLPQSRIGSLLALFAVATALAIAAVVQIRRQRALAEMRHDFVTRTSHELRTPVARIRIFTDTLLLERVRDDEERREAVRAIDRAARRLSWLVENVLQVSRSAAVETDLQLARADIVSVVREVVAEFEMTISGARVVVRETPSAADALLDRDAFGQALLNLLDNAWKYGGSDRPIGVSVSVARDEIQLRVADSGPGVPERDRVRIWEPYVRLERDRRSSVAGTGIGLAVVRDIVHRHRGRAWVEASDSGGAVFVVALPAVQLLSEPLRSSA
jgi:two-component system phosphate regulon sensor histidine kinase PhoR